MESIRGAYFLSGVGSPSCRGGMASYWKCSPIDRDAWVVPDFPSSASISGLSFHTYSSGQVNWDASKLLTQKSMRPKLGRRLLTQKVFGATQIIFLVFLISLIDAVPEINSRCTVQSWK